MHYNHIENIAESIGTAQSILKSLLAQRFTSNSDLIGSNDDKEVLHEYAQPPQSVLIGLRKRQPQPHLPLPRTRANWRP